LSTWTKLVKRCFIREGVLDMQGVKLKKRHSLSFLFERPS